MNKHSYPILYWTPRILGLIFVLFTALFAFDVFREGLGFWEIFIALLMHLIPTLILAVILIIAWRWELSGSLLYGLIAVFYVYWFWGRFPLSTYLIMSGIPFLVGILFTASWTFSSMHAEGQPRPKTYFYTAIAVFVFFFVILYAMHGLEANPDRSMILKPEAGAEVIFREPAEGYCALADTAKHLWLVVQEGDSGAFHPQWRIFNPPTVSRWYSRVYFGNEGDDLAGTPFSVYLFAAEDSTNRFFNDYLETNRESGQWRGLASLPGGITPLDTVKVIRK